MRSGFAAILILLIGITAAGAGETKIPEACKLLTLQDVTSVVGGGYKRNEVYKGPYCGYNGPNDAEIFLNVGGALAQNASAALKQIHATFKSSDRAMTDVPGLGDGAFYTTETNSVQLLFGKGQWLATLGVRVGPKPNVDAALKLGKVVFAKMP